MTEQKAYLRQARSDFRVFQILLEQDRDHMPACHPLHHLQMATEKLAKAATIAMGVRDFDRYSHVAFSHIPYLLSRRDVAAKLGWPKARFKHFQSFLKRATPIFREIEELNPSVGPRAGGLGSNEGPNVEYPWRARDATGAGAWHVPADWSFRLIEDLRSGDAAKVLQFVDVLLDRFEVVFARR